MKRCRNIVCGLITAVLVSLSLASPAAAAASGLQIQPVLPAQQRSGTSSYFDVVLAPLQSTQLQVRVTNATSKAMTVKASVAPAQTSDAGAVVYESSLKHKGLPSVNIADLITSTDQTLSVPANSEVMYMATLTMPSTSVSGVAAGGICFEDANQKEAANSSGIGITSKYRYVVAVLAHNQESSVHPKLGFGAATVVQKNYKNSLEIPVNNSAPTYLNELEIDSTAQLQGSSTKYTKNATMMQMAPTSAFSYSLDLPDDVVAGTYDVTSTAYYVKDSAGKYKDASGQRYRYRVTHTDSVTVTPEKAKTLVSSIERVREVRTGLSWWVYALIGVFLLLLILLLLAYRAYRRTKREAEKLRADAGLQTEVTEKRD